MTINTKRVSLVLVFLAASGTLLGTIDHQKEFVAHYPEAKAKLNKCSTCHTKPMAKKGDAEVNAYGKDLQAVMSADKKTMDFDKIKDKDSDGDGVANLAEIKAGTNPGDAKSK